MASSLFDTLAGGFGHGVDRPGLEAFVANSQAVNGLRSAQTEEAINNAASQQEEMAARAKLEDTIGKTLGPDGSPMFSPSQAHMAAQAFIAQHGGKVSDGINALVDMQKAHNTMVLSNPGNISTPADTAAAAGNTNKAPEALPLSNEYQLPAGVAPPNAGQTPLGAAQTNETNALAGLNAHKNTDPAAFRASAFGATPPEGIAALTKAVQEGRLDPTRLNARTAPILAQIEGSSPGTNFNRLHADANLQANATFQQKAMSVDMLPGLLQNVTSLGKKLNDGAGYNDLKSVGTMQQWMNGQTNDPDYTEYMTARNDTLLRLAGVMRGVGMSDQAHTAEVEAMAPTLAPAALDAWMKGQMSVVNPLLDRQNRITHLGEKGQGTQPLSVPASTATGAGPQKFDTEEQAAAAGLPSGTKVIVGGVPGTWH